MQWVSIQEASRTLNVSQHEIRRYAREGRLQAKRQPNENGGTSWVVLLPEDGWEDDFKQEIAGLAKVITPWWWPTFAREGDVHYVESLGIEEVEPVFLCGFKSNDIFPATGHAKEQRCAKCLIQVEKLGLPLETRE